MVADATCVTLLSLSLKLSQAPSVSKSCPFYSQKHVQVTCRHNFDCHPDVGLGFSLVRLVACWDCRVTTALPALPASFARSTKDALAVWGTMNNHRLCYKTTISDVFGVRLHGLLAGFSGRYLSVGK